MDETLTLKELKFKFHWHSSIRLLCASSVVFHFFAHTFLLNGRHRWQSYIFRSDDVNLLANSFQFEHFTWQSTCLRIGPSKSHCPVLPCFSYSHLLTFQLLSMLTYCGDNTNNTYIYIFIFNHVDFYISPDTLNFT